MMRAHNLSTISFPMTEKNKATLVVTLIVVALSCAFLYQGISYHIKVIDEMIRYEEEEFSQVIEVVEQYSFQTYKERVVSLLQNNEPIVRAFAERDRELLYNLVLPKYGLLQRENKYFYVMHFHLPDNMTFLRMHNPDFFGDDLTGARPIVAAVHKTKKQLSGYEIGRNGPFYRVVQPVFYNNEYAGALEFGIRVHQVSEEVNERVGTDVTSFFKAENWKKATRVKAEYIDFGSYVIISHGETVMASLPPDIHLEDSQEITVADKSYAVHFHPIFKDYQGESIGGMLLFQDITHAVHQKNRFITHALLFTGALLCCSFVVLYLTFGRIVGALDREVSGRVKAEEEKRRLGILLGNIVNSMPSVLVGIDRENRVIQWNDEAERKTGISAEKAEGRMLEEVMPQLSGWMEEVRHSISRSGVHKKIRMEEERDGETDYSDMTVYPLVADGVEGAVIRIDDVTDHVRSGLETIRLQARLQQAQKMEAVGTLAGGIAHDFNNVLAIIMGFSELALLKLPEESNAKEDMKRVFDAGIRAREMIKQILTFSRQRKFELEPLYLHLVLKESLKLLRASIPSTIEIQEDIETKNDTVLADLTHMQQMIMNLVTNAYHAMREKGGVLSIRLFPVAMDSEKVEAQGLVLEPGKYLQLDVGDTGEGMDKRVMERIFEPYFTTKEMGKGTGMGLAIVHGIVINHGGDITVASESGKGTVFHVYLPLREKSSVKEVEERQEYALPEGKESLLIVDDEEHLLEMEKQMLTGLGYKVTAMNDSEEALKRFIVTPDAFDLVITDMTMPHMNGVELVRKLFAVKPELPVILCTGYSELINEQKAKMLGIREYMMKPIALEKMARVVRKALDEGKSEK